MSVNLAAFLYLVSGVLFILALRGLVASDDQPSGQYVRHDRYGDFHRHHASAGASKLRRPRS